MKFETFIKEKRIEPTPTEKSVREWAKLPPAGSIKKFYCVRVFCGGHCVDELEFSNAIDAQNYIQKSEQFYSHFA